VQSGLWATIPAAQQSVLVALLSFIDPFTLEGQVSNRGLLRYSGRGSASTICAAIRTAERMNFLRVERQAGPRQDWPMRSCNTFILTPNDPRFCALAETVARQHREEVEVERAARKAGRQQLRREKSALGPVTGEILFNWCSVASSHATADVALNREGAGRRETDSVGGSCAHC
jgi:hypothetical protein